MRTLSGVMDIFCILKGVRVTWDFSFVKTAHLRSVHINLHKFYLKKKQKTKTKYKADEKELQILILVEAE